MTSRTPVSVSKPPMPQGVEHIDKTRLQVEYDRGVQTSDAAGVEHMMD